MNFQYLTSNWREVLHLTGQHLQLSVTAILIGLAIAIPLALIASRVRPLTLPILSFLDAVYTIPSLAFLAVLIIVPGVGIGRTNALIVLVSYAQLYLVRNIVTALRGVDPSLLEAARGTGMTGMQVFFQVQLPLALPIIIAGIRTALVTTISLATVTAWISAGGLGTLLFDGINRNYPSEILAGAIAITGLALIIDGMLRLLERTTAISRATRAAH